MVSSIPEFLCHQMNIVFHFFLAISFITQISEANQLFWHHDIDDLFKNFLGQLDRQTPVCIGLIQTLYREIKKQTLPAC